ncbi:hypothetical protein FX155_07830 [Acidaminococcus fermentans]|uniref:Uncharacterized protein n=1 Tax=Acidaminococcus fermentans TaxID=905 RepID=A0A6N7VZC5_ACIFE|nr:hypothetical protein [Acidaminococcus fermentans]MSS82501.1 hypothetical protein [Acidaminococcus fermentans]
MSEQRKIRVTKIKWNRTSPEISYEESLDNATKTIGGMQAKGIIPHVDFIQAVEDLKADFLAMMELKADDPKKISLEAEISFDAAAGKKYSTPDYTFTGLPDSTQRKIRRVLEEAALYVTGKSAQTVLNFGDRQEPKALESGRKKVTA